MFERFTERARQVVVLAHDEAKRLQHGYIGVEHILWGLCAEAEGIAAKALTEHDITTVDVHRALVRLMPEGEEEVEGQLPFTPRARKLLESSLREALSFESSLREALSLGHNYIGTEHILLALLRFEGIAIDILTERRVPTEAVRETVLRLLSGRTGEEAPVQDDAGTQRLDLPDLPTPSAMRRFVSRSSGEAYRRGWNDGYNAGIRESGR